MSEAMPEPLAALIREFDAASARLHRLVDRLDDEAWSRPPAPGGWSAAQCVAHLNLTMDAMLPRIRAALDEGRRGSPGGAAPRYRLDFFGWLLVRALEPPARFRTKTGTAFEPASAGSRVDEVAAFDRGQAAIVDVIRESRALRVDRLRIVSPFDPRQRLRYSVYSAFRIVAAHERRHLWQAERAAQCIQGHTPPL